ncbi:MAG TPA: MarR family transcriptional regulator [Pseudonocardiaceae bacterium]|jgi:DNA-binding MarR family transcriptional regulator|nr:MarR family transcriptional regulator [Pseudonocardiaceae bacterium]
MSDSSTEPGLALDEQLCFALYSASRAITARYRPLLDEMGLTYPQYLVMLALWESGPATVGQLGKRLTLDSGTLSPLLKRLEASGLISRRRRVDDERSVEIVLTGDGHRLRERATCLPAAIGVATGLDADGAARWVTALHDLTDAVRADLERESNQV